MTQHGLQSLTTQQAVQTRLHWNVRQFEVFWYDPNPTTGSEIQKVRPGVVVSPDEANASLRVVTLVPLTTQIRKLPWRVPTQFQGMNGQAVLEQIRTVDKSRLICRGGMLAADESNQLLLELFKYFGLERFFEIVRA